MIWPQRLLAPRDQLEEKVREEDGVAVEAAEAGDPSRYVPLETENEDHSLR